MKILDNSSIIELDDNALKLAITSLENIFTEINLTPPFQYASVLDHNDKMAILKVNNTGFLIFRNILIDVFKHIYCIYVLIFIYMLTNITYYCIIFCI